MAQKAKLQVDDEVEANVIQTTDDEGRTTTRATFKAKATLEDDEQLENEDLGGADRLEFTEEPIAEEIPKTRLERMFDDIRAAMAADRLQDHFYCYVIRQPDGINSRFARPCNTEIDLGVFQFTSRQQFEFVQAIQERNGRSGGVFNIRIYNANREPLYRPLANTFSYRTSEHGAPIGIGNFEIPDPFVEPEADASNGGMIATLVAEMRRQHDDFIQVTREMLANKKDEHKEPSILERAIERKLLKEIENPTPPTPQGENSFEKAMAQMILLPQMAERFSRHMFPDPPPPPAEVEPDIIDKLDKFGNSRAGQMMLPILGNIVERFSETAQAFAVSRMKLNDDSTDGLDADHYQETPQPQRAINPAENEMQELIQIIISEIESENPLDASNATIQALRADYPAQAEQLIITCQSAPFDVVLNLLINQTKRMQPSPFLPFVDVEASQKANGKFVWNDRGQKALKRLAEFHAYLGSLPV